MGKPITTMEQYLSILRKGADDRPEALQQLELFDPQLPPPQETFPISLENMRRHHNAAVGLRVVARWSERKVLGDVSKQLMEVTELAARLRHGVKLTFTVRDDQVWQLGILQMQGLKKFFERINDVKRRDIVERLSEGLQAAISGDKHMSKFFKVKRDDDYLVDALKNIQGLTSLTAQYNAAREVLLAAQTIGDVLLQQATRYVVKY